MFLYNSKRGTQALLWLVSFSVMILSFWGVTFLSAEAADEVLYENEGGNVAMHSPFISEPIDASSHTSLEFSFDFDATKLDGDPQIDNFTYGYIVDASSTIIGSFKGLPGSSATETDSLLLDLPAEAEVEDLMLFVEVTTNSTSSSDTMVISNVKLAGDLKGSEVVDVCLNIAGDQMEVPEGFEVDNEGNCTEIENEITDLCPNLEGDQGTVPEGLEVNGDGDCVEIVVEVIDMCPNLQGDQETIPEGYEIDNSGDCVELESEVIDLCPNLEDDQETVPEGYELNEEGHCIEITPEPTDVCLNLEGDQETVPEGFELGSNGDCVEIVVDLCPNLDGTQETVPEGYEVDSNGDCIEKVPEVIDMCPNLEGDQETIPEGYEVNNDGHCVEIETEPEVSLCPSGYVDWANKLTRDLKWRTGVINEQLSLVRASSGSVGYHNTGRNSTMLRVNTDRIGRSLDRISHVCVGR